AAVRWPAWPAALRLTLARRRQPRAVDVARAARASWGTRLSRHVLARDGAQGIRRRRDRRRDAARPVRDERARLPVPRRTGKELPLYEARVGRVPRRAGGRRRRSRRSGGRAELGATSVGGYLNITIGTH